MALNRRRSAFFHHKRHIGSYRYWLYGFNLVLITVLFAFVAVTCKILHKDRMFLFPLDHSEPLVLYLFLGPLVQLLDILTGLVGVWRRRTTLLTIYWWFLLVILLSDLVVGILWIFRWRSLHSASGKHFLNSLTTQYESPDFCRRWNSVQSELSCCGIYSFSDWNRVDTFCHEQLGNGSLPESCCANVGDPQMVLLCGIDGNGREIAGVFAEVSPGTTSRPPGCRDPLIKWLYHQSNIIFLLGICVVVFLKVVGLVIMRTEIRQLGDEIFARENRNTLIAQPKFSVDLSPFATGGRQSDVDCSIPNTANGSIANMRQAKETVRLVVTDCQGIDKEESC